MTKNTYYTDRKMHTIAVDNDNYEALSNMGTVADSFNDVIGQLIKVVKEKS